MKKIKKEVERFYEEGFVPYRVIDGVSEETFNKLVFEKNKILEKKNNFSKFSVDYEEDTNLIKNDAFASILNAEGELLVGDKIYKYTSNGLYIVDKSDIDYLDKYLKNHKNKPNVGLVKINDKITSYVPNPEDFKKFKVIKNIEEIESNIVQLGYPINTSNYQQCSVARPFWKIFLGEHMFVNIISILKGNYVLYLLWRIIICFLMFMLNLNLSKKLGLGGFLQEMQIKYI